MENDCFQKYSQILLFMQSTKMEGDLSFSLRFGSSYLVVTASKGFQASVHIDWIISGKAFRLL